jgi:LEM3-like protein
MYYVYELIDPRTEAVFYVGKGKGSRIHAHELEARKGRVSRKCDAIRDIEAGGFSVTKRTVQTFANEQDAYDFEAGLITRYGLANLTNVNPGGAGGCTDPALVADRTFTEAAAELINRSRNGQISALLVNGQLLDLVAILDEYKQRVAEAMALRGEDWVNALARRYGVEFAHGRS